MARTVNWERILRVWRCLHAVQSVRPLIDPDDPELPDEIMATATGLPDPDPADWVRTVLAFNRAELALRAAEHNEDVRVQMVLSSLPPDDAKRVQSVLDVQALYRKKGPLSLDRYGDLMEIYRATAVLFNSMLADDQAEGERLDEKPTTAAAVQKMVTRYPDPDSV